MCWVDRNNWSIDPSLIINLSLSGRLYLRIQGRIARSVSNYKYLFKNMSSSDLTLNRSAESATSEREQQIARLTKALYQDAHQQKFLDLQAELDTLLQQLQSSR